MYRVLIVALFKGAIIILGYVMYIISSITKRGDIVGDAPFGSYGESFFTKYNLFINIFTHVVLIILFIIFWILYLYPLVKDIPNAIQDDYIVTSGEVVSWDYTQENTNKLRVISVKSGENEEITVHVYGYGVHKGDTITVAYFPNSKYGKVVYE